MSSLVDFQGLGGNPFPQPSIAHQPGQTRPPGKLETFGSTGIRNGIPRSWAIVWLVVSLIFWTAGPALSAGGLDREHIEEAIEATPHAGLSCDDCHAEAEIQPGLQGKPQVECLTCHQRHGASMARDPHLSVACGACHLKGIVPVRDSSSGQVSFQWDRDPGHVPVIHGLEPVDRNTSCRRCHVSENRVGASALVLPKKSLLCLPCHPATLSAQDPITIASLAILAGGLIWLGFIVFAPSNSKEKNESDRGRLKAGPVLSAIWLDVLGQRRLWRQSRARWAIHGLIFYGMLVRFLWSLAAMILSQVRPEWSFSWTILDRNAPLTALVFDVTGLAILIGIFLAWIRPRIGEKGRQSTDLPRSDTPALALLGGCVLVGLVLEGVRLAMTGLGPGSVWALAGYLLSLPWLEVSGLPRVYSWLWYIHAGLFGAFVAYLPFSRMLHIILAPMVLIAKARSKH